ncbi:two-component sensor histidine kinase, partial [Dermatophilus congolensis]
WVGRVVGVGAERGVGGVNGGGVSVRDVRSSGSVDTSEMFDRLIAAFKECVMVIDSRDRVVRSSPSTSVMGLLRGQDLVHDELRAVVRHARRMGQSSEHEFTLTRDRFVDARVSVAVRAVDLGSGFVALFVEDRTRAQRVEDVRRDFVANVSHELKTPVGGIALLAEAVLDACEDPQTVARFARRIQMESSRLTRLVQDIVDLSRLQVDEAISDPVPVTVTAVVRDALESVQTLAESRDVEMVFEGDERAQVVGDHRMLVIAVSNLLSNAINYSAERTRVAVTVRSVGGVVEVAVADQGTGIAPEALERVFERFYRVDEARSRATGGTGLGLAIVKHICTNHGGEVKVWSKLGEGSTFTVRLPQMPGVDAVSGGVGV